MAAVMTKTAPIFSNHGCRLNAYETEAMKELAAAAGVDNAIVVNTCAVTSEAVRKARQDIRKDGRSRCRPWQHREDEPGQMGADGA